MIALQVVSGTPTSLAIAVNVSGSSDATSNSRMLRARATAGDAEASPSEPLPGEAVRLVTPLVLARSLRSAAVAEPRALMRAERLRIP
jgi:hypothetical protein